MPSSVDLKRMKCQHRQYLAYSTAGGEKRLCDAVQKLDF